MADCEETLRELYRFLDGEVPAEQQHLISHHLDGCMDCLQAFDFHAELRMVIRVKARETDVPPGLLDKIRACFGDVAAADLTDDPA
jgi:mycothiol system anti-sigma-R factor